MFVDLPVIFMWSLTVFDILWQVEDALEKVKKAESHPELLNNINAFGCKASELMAQAAKRQQELKDPQLRDDLAAARAVLKKHSTMLLTASKVEYLRNFCLFSVATFKKEGFS